MECSLDRDTSAWRSYGRERQGERVPTPEEEAVIERLAAEERAHSQAYDQHQEAGDPDAEDYDAIEQQLCETLDRAEEKLMDVRADLRQWRPEQLLRAGVLIRLDHRGQVVQDRGLVRPSDRKAGADNTGAGDESPPRDQVATARPEFSEKLLRDLTSHRTAAVQAALVQNPHVALVTLVHRMAETVFGLYGTGDDIVKVAVRPTGDSALGELASEYADSPAAVILGGAETEWGDRLPGTPAALFSWLLAQPQETVLDLLAYCTARSVNAVAGRPRGRNHSDALAEALGVDMSDWWVATPRRYLASVSKGKALEAVKEATGADPTQATAGMKKADLVGYCAAKLEGTRWLPAPLRRCLDQGSDVPDDVAD
ncbi:hypothetical protein J7E70_26645 [Variovorax paradoxus]|nr:hypothetical protein [Variovorax paradoxus]MBT2304022.1 hypothetical protein [Variovorax paradoxus]